MARFSLKLKTAASLLPDDQDVTERIPQSPWVLAEAHQRHVQRPGRRLIKDNALGYFDLSQSSSFPVGRFLQSTLHLFPGPWSDENGNQDGRHDEKCQTHHQAGEYHRSHMELPENRPGANDAIPERIQIIGEHRRIGQVSVKRHHDRRRGGMVSNPDVDTLAFTGTVQWAVSSCRRAGEEDGEGELLLICSCSRLFWATTTSTSSLSSRI
jgi:hypothetical protein